MLESGGGPSIRKLEKGDTDQCADLWIESMAEGYQDSLMLTNAAAGTEGYIGVAAENDGELVGFGAGHVVTFAASLSVPYRLVSEQCPIKPDSRVTYLDVVAVDDEWRTEGVGTELINRLFQKATNQHLPIITETWNREGVDGAAIVEKTPMEHIVTREDYWTFSSSGYDDCPECSDSPCSCSGTLFATLPPSPSLI